MDLFWLSHVDNMHGRKNKKCNNNNNNKKPSHIKTRHNWDTWYVVDTYIFIRLHPNGCVYSVEQ